MAWDVDEFCTRHSLDDGAAAELRRAVGATMVDPDDSLLADRAAPTPGLGSPIGHLTLQDRLGGGGMGEVWRAHDARLERTVALKLLGPRLAHDAAARARFLAEARATAQLAHPGIVSVHELGTWSDGRPFYTMDVVRGETLGAQIAAHHASPEPGNDGLNRLVDRLRRACEAVGYAHARGVVHRDLKPDNILVGAFGEVLVADWGLVRADPDAQEPVHTGRDGDLTIGMAGTPRYMSPEQVTGGAIGPASDVFSLGALLALVLQGASAFPQDDVHEVLAAVAAARAVLPEVGPEPLRRVAARALAAAPADRFPDAGALAGALGRYLDGAERRARALAEVAEAEALAPRVDALRARAAAERALAAHALEGVAPWMPLERKLEGWRHEDAAHRLIADAEALERERLDHAEAALSHQEDLPEALALLAAHHRAQLEAAEAARDPGAAAAAERALRRVDRGAHAAFLEGRSALSLHTTPAGARVVARRLVVIDRRRVAVEPHELGRTPLDRVPLAMGDHVLTIEAEGHQPVTLPVSVRRGEHLDGVPPHGREPASLWLPPLGALGPGDAYVPAGWAWLGADGLDFTTEPLRRVWVDGVVVRTFPVTHAEYLRFLDDVLAHRGEDEALRWVPRERSSKPDEPGPMCYGRTDDGRFCLVPDADGDLWDPMWPAMLVDWHAACAYAAWEAARTGQPWRLPTVAEWEKAGRGADGRLFPWGDHPDPALMCVRESHRTRPLPATIHSYPLDRSPYGVRGLAGNMRDWCADPAGAAGEQRALRGGCWFFPAKAAMLPIPYAIEPHRVGDTIGFRLARSVPA